MSKRYEPSATYWEEVEDLQGDLAARFEERRLWRPVPRLLASTVEGDWEAPSGAPVNWEMRLMFGGTMQAVSFLTVPDYKGVDPLTREEGGMYFKYSAAFSWGMDVREYYTSHQALIETPDEELVEDIRRIAHFQKSIGLAVMQEEHYERILAELKYGEYVTRPLTS